MRYKSTALLRVKKMHAKGAKDRHLDTSIQDSRDEAQHDCLCCMIFTVAIALALFPPLWLTPTHR